MDVFEYLLLLLVFFAGILGGGSVVRQTRVLQFCTFGPSTRSHSSSLWARRISTDAGQELSRRGRARRSEDRTYGRGVLGAGAERIDRAIGRARQSGRLSCASRRVVPLRQARRVEDALPRAGTARRQHHRRSQQVGQPAPEVRAPAQRGVAEKTLRADATVEGRNALPMGLLGNAMAGERNSHHDGRNSRPT